MAVAERSDGGGGEMPGSLLKQDSRELRQSEGNIGCHRSKREGVASRASRGVGESAFVGVLAFDDKSGSKHSDFRFQRNHYSSDENLDQVFAPECCD